MKADPLEVLIIGLTKIQSTHLYQSLFRYWFHCGVFLFYHKRYQAIQQNKEFYRKHEGERCFILGNGPSLNNFEFDLLANENVFTVNRLMLHPDFPKLHSNYHMWMDPYGLVEADFSDSKIVCNVLDDFKKLKDAGDPYLFLPAYVEENIKKTGLDKHLKIRYVVDSGSNAIRNEYLITDMARGISGAINVVQFTITLAIYMGFKEIYLLGCDATFLQPVIDNLLNLKESKLHAYNDTKEDIVSNIDQYLNSGLTPHLSTFADYMNGFGYIARYCKKHGIILVNLTPTTLINSIEKANLSDILSKIP